MKLIIEDQINTITEIYDTETILELADFDVGLRQMLEAAESTTTIMTDDISLVDSDTVLQFLDPGGADRVVTLPAEDAGNHGFLIFNIADAAENIVVKNDAGSELATVYPDGAGWIVSNRSIWRSAGLGTINPDSIIYVEIGCALYGQSVAVQDAVGQLVIPPKLDGRNLVSVHQQITDTNGTTGTQTVQIENATDSVDMLTTVSSVDSGEDGSDTAVAPCIIDTDNDDVASYDVLLVHVKTIHTTPAKGLVVTLGFGLP